MPTGVNFLTGDSGLPGRPIPISKQTQTAANPDGD